MGLVFGVAICEKQRAGVHGRPLAAWRGALSLVGDMAPRMSDKRVLAVPRSARLVDAPSKPARGGELPSYQLEWELELRGLDREQFGTVALGLVTSIARPGAQRYFPSLCIDC